MHNGSRSGFSLLAMKKLTFSLPRSAVSCD